MGYPANTLSEPCINAPKSAESPNLATGMPSAKTVRDPALITAGCPSHLSGQHTRMVWGSNGSPGLNTFEPLANTDLAVALQPMNFVQACPVVAKSLMSLDIAGIQVFMDAKNCYFFLSARCIASGINWGFSSHPTTGASTRK